MRNAHQPISNSSWSFGSSSSSASGTTRGQNQTAQLITKHPLQHYSIYCRVMWWHTPGFSMDWGIRPLLSLMGSRWMSSFSSFCCIFLGIFSYFSTGCSDLRFLACTGALCVSTKEKWRKKENTHTQISGDHSVHSLRRKKHHMLCGGSKRMF